MSRAVLLLLLWLSPAFAERAYVNNPDQLAYHFRRHVQRVTRLGLTAYDDNRAEFSAVTRELVAEYLSAHHDPNKFRPVMLRRLFRIYGVGRNPADPRVKALVARTVRELNRRDTAHAMAFFAARGMLDVDGKPDERARALLSLERIADRLDRNRDPVAREEFDDPDEHDLAGFLSGRELDIAREILPRYRELTRGLAYVDPPCIGWWETLVLAH